MIGIVAGTMRQMEDAAREHGLLRDGWFPILGAEHVMGLRYPKVIKAGTYYQLRDWPEIEARLSAAGVKYL